VLGRNQYEIDFVAANRHKREIRASQIAPDDRRGSRDTELQFAGMHGLHDHAATRNVDQPRVEAMLFKKARLLGNPKWRLRTCKGTKGKIYSLCECVIETGEQEKNGDSYSLARAAHGHAHFLTALKNARQLVIAKVVLPD